MYFPPKKYCPNESSHQQHRCLIKQIPPDNFQWHPHYFRLDFKSKIFGEQPSKPSFALLAVHSRSEENTQEGAITMPTCRHKHKTTDVKPSLHAIQASFQTKKEDTNLFSGLFPN